MEDHKKELEALQKPFNSNEIEWRVGSTNSDKTKGLALPYITNRAIQKRLDEVFGIYGWKNEFKEWKGKEQLCGISVWNKELNEWVTKWDGASDTQTEATKGGLSGAMKRAAAQWGIGRYLYDISQMWVKIKPVGTKSYKLAEIPKLPEWALPKNQTKTEKPAPKWDTEENEIEIPESIKKCVEAFKPLGITKEELECYLYKEAFTFDEKDIQTLKMLYLQIKNNQKSKDDFLNTVQKNTSGRSKTAETLEQKLSDTSE